MLKSQEEKAYFSRGNIKQ